MLKRSKSLAFIALIILIIFHYYHSFNEVEKLSVQKSNEVRAYNEHIHTNRIQELIDFEGFDNQNGTSHPIIPNIAHYIFLNKPTIEFYHMVNIFSLFFNHRPEKIYFHCDNCSFTGKFFDALKSNKELWSLIDIHHIPPKKTIFGQEYGYGNFHR
jgi:hypothetical protein